MGGHVSGRDVGGGEEARLEPGEIELLGVLVAAGGERTAEEGVEALRSDAAMADLGVVGAEFQQERLVGGEKRRPLRSPRVPDQRRLPALPENAAKLVARPRRVEPVERLSCDDQVDARGEEPGGFGRARLGAEARIAPERLLGCGPHRSVRLDADDFVATGEKELGRDARARSDVGDDGTRWQGVGGDQVVDQGWRVARPGAHIVVDPAGEACGGVLRFRGHTADPMSPCAGDVPLRKAPRTAQNPAGKS